MIIIQLSGISFMIIAVNDNLMKIEYNTTLLKEFGMRQQ